MSRSTLENILEGCTSKLRKIEYCLSGEPTMNKELPEFISLTKKKYPDVKNLVLSNTDLMRTKYGFGYLIDLFDRGMDYIQTDLYDQESKDWFIDECKKNKDILKDRGIQIFDYYKVPFNLYSYGKKIKTIFF
ncbi:hypothetical protein LCGC14_1441890 [marine sediment metagenome]|uniref:Radical SAM core domain-containing protein n=1 Tax=marine sediment metagenome TaxID=412755 RepID=A0A0F9K6Q4_9ZZZZ